ncbi:MAG: EVE domain-containing protein [Caldimonas sp.]
MRYWLMKSEPGECSVDDAAAAPNATVPWVGVRNFQARNFMKNDMSVGDGVLFYHSSCPEPGIAGLAEVASNASVDETQFDPKSPYFDEKSRRESPKWWHVDVKVVEKTPLLSLAAMRLAPELQSMRVLQRGNRLSITPVSDDDWKAVNRLIDKLS